MAFDVVPPMAPTGVAHSFATGLARFGSAPALVFGEEVVSYEDLAGRVVARAREIGDSRTLVLIEARNDVSTVVDYLACLAGRHPVILTCHGSAATQHLSEQYLPQVSCESGALTRHDQQAPDLHPDLALMLSTSGTTGSAKLVRLSYQNLQSNAEAIAASLAIRPSDRAITSLPLSYCYGLSVLNSHLSVGAAVILTDLSVTQPEFWDTVAHHEVTTFPGVPHTFDLLERVGFARMQIPSLRYITQAGGHMPAEQVRRFAELGQQRGFDLVVMYGQTEATARMAVLPPDLARSHPDAIGLPIPGGNFTIDASLSTDCRGGSDVGELVYAGPNVMLGYATSRADLALGRMTTKLHTGDLARRGDDGLVRIVGRRNRIAKIFGLRIDLDQLEQYLNKAGIHAGCTANDSRLLIGFDSRHDPAFVVDVARQLTKLPASAATARKVRTLPRTPSGKFDYQALAEVAAADEPPKRRPQRAQSVQDLYAHLLARPDARHTDSFVTLGGDSLSYVEVTVRLEELIGPLPHNWQTASIAELQALRQNSRSAWAPLETSVVLRALAIACIVGTHAGVFALLGGAHLLLAIAGFTFAKFVLPRPSRTARLKQIGKAVASIAVPTIAVGVVANLLTGMYSWTTPFLLNWATGVDHWTVDRQFWFIEVLIASLLLSAAVLYPVTLDRWERAHTFTFPMVLVAIGTTWQLALTVSGNLPANRFGTFHFVFWLFALGWAIAQSRTVTHRVAVSVMALIGLVGFFDDPWRDAFVLGGLALLIWTKSLSVPRLLTRPICVVAASSLYIYLVHWQIYSAVSSASPLLSLVVCLGLGVALWSAVTAAQRRTKRQTLATALR